MLAPNPPQARDIVIAHGDVRNCADVAPLRCGESIIRRAHWEQMVAASKRNAAAFIVAVGLRDERSMDAGVEE
jgi:hypothetical protein